MSMSMSMNILNGNACLLTCFECSAYIAVIWNTKEFDRIQQNPRNLLAATNYGRYVNETILHIC